MASQLISLVFGVEMERENRILLMRLTDAEKQVLALRCDHLSNKQVAMRLGVKEVTVEFHLSSIYAKLGLKKMGNNERKEFLQRHFCEMLRTMLAEAPTVIEKKRRPIPRSRAIVEFVMGTFAMLDPRIRKMVEDDEPPGDENIIDVEPEKPKTERTHPDIIFTVPKQLPPPKRREHPLLLGLILGFLLASVLFYGIYRFYLLPTLPTNPTAIAAAQTATAVVFKTSTATEMPTPEPTRTRIPTKQFFVTSTSPTSTEGPSPTPTITKTLRPTIVPSSTPHILFSDNFDNGLSGEWTVVAGEPVITEGRLYANTPTWLVVGDPTWGDIKVKIRLALGQNANGSNVLYDWYTGWEIFLCFRYQDSANMIPLKTGRDGFRWFWMKDGKWEASQSFGQGTKDEYPHEVIVYVSGDSYTAFVNGNKSTSLIKNIFPNGKFAIRMAPTTWMDDLVIEKYTGDPP